MKNDIQLDFYLKSQKSLFSLVCCHLLQAQAHNQYALDNLEEAQQLLGERNIVCGKTDLSEICELLTARDINLEEITLIGSLTTIRYEQHLPIGLAALDKNDYLGHTDYELELEVDDSKQGKKDFFSEFYGVSFFC